MNKEKIIGLRRSPAVHLGLDQVYAAIAAPHGWGNSRAGMWVALVKGVALIVFGYSRGSARRWRRECGGDSWGLRCCAPSTHGVREGSSERKATKDALAKQDIFGDALARDVSGCEINVQSDVLNDAEPGDTQDGCEREGIRH